MRWWLLMIGSLTGSFLTFWCGIHLICYLIMHVTETLPGRTHVPSEHPYDR